jgi:hypothetical protein
MWEQLKVELHRTPDHLVDGEVVELYRSAVVEDFNIDIHL